MITEPLPAYQPPVAGTNEQPLVSASLSGRKTQPISLIDEQVNAVVEGNSYLGIRWKRILGITLMATGILALIAGIIAPPFIAILMFTSTPVLNALFTLCGAVNTVAGYALFQDARDKAMLADKTKLELMFRNR